MSSRELGVVEPEMEYPAWGPVFLQVYSKMRNLSSACKAAGISRQTALNARQGTRRRPPNAQFVEDWETAEHRATDLLLAKAWTMALVQGNERILLALLKAYVPEQFDRPKSFNVQQDVTVRTEEHYNDLRERIRHTILTVTAPAGEGSHPQLPDGGGAGGPGL